jgi:hypothetical protein
MARKKNTTDPPEQRCPNCNSDLRILPLESGGEHRACGQCGWHTPGFEKLQIEKSPWLEAMALADKQRQAIGQQVADVFRQQDEQLRRYFLGEPSETEQWVLDFRKKFPSPAATPAPAAELPNAVVQPQPVLAVPKKNPGRPRKDDLRQFAQQLKAAGKTEEEIRAAIKEKFGVNLAGIRHLFRSK